MERETHYIGENEYLRLKKKLRSIETTFIMKSMPYSIVFCVIFKNQLSINAPH